LIFRDEEPDVSKLPEALGKLVGREDLDAESLHPHARVLYPGQPDRDARAIIRPERQALSYITLEIDVNTALVSDSGKAALVVLDVRRIHAPTKRVLSKGQMLEVWQHQERWTLFRRLYIRKAVRAAYVRPFGWLDHSEPQAEGVHAIRDAAALSAAAWTARDLAGAMAVWADDATRTTLSTVPQEVQREAIAEDYRTAFKRPAWITAAWAFEEINVLDGDVAVTLSRLSRSSPGRQVTRPTTLRRLDVWQKEPAKPWRIVRSVQYPIL
ncbi:MAG: nuclear transport factor 2 family protein, partial [Myxococcota bacterium]